MRNLAENRKENYCHNNAVAMSVLLLVLSTRVEKKVENLRIYDVLCSIGHNSICYLVLNQIVIRHSICE